MNIKWVVVLLTLLLVGLVQATPTTGVAFAISSNNFTVPVTGSDGGDVWIAWGQASGAYPYASPSAEPFTGDGNVLVYGAPIIGGSTVYYKACDSTGCGAERSLNILAITPLPTTTFGKVYNNLTSQHFKITMIPQSIVAVYATTQVSITLYAGIAFFFLFVGFWFRTRSVRLALLMGLLMAVFIITPTAGLMLGAPVLFQMVAQGLMAAAIAGVLLGFIRK
jgi:hypothetical protein